MRTDPFAAGALPAHCLCPTGCDPKEPMTNRLQRNCAALRWRVLTAALALALGAALALVGSPAALAETSPYVVGVSETISHDSNVVRLPDGATPPASLYASTDWIATTALFAGIDQPFGRQRGYGSVSLRNNHYRYNQDYGNLAYGLAAGLDWSTVERVSGTVSLSSNRTLASFDRANGNNTPILVKNIEQTDQFGATAQIGLVTDLSFVAGYQRQSQRFSAVGDKLVQNIVNLGTRYRLGGELTLGAGLRFTHGRYPDNNDSFKGRNLDLNADWSPNPISTVTARVGLGKTDHSAAAAQDFSGATGAVAWTWKPTAKLAFISQLNRATGTDSSFQQVVESGSIVSAQADNSRLTTTLGLNATYEATAKILLNAGYNRASRKLTNALANNAGLLLTDGDRLTRSRIGLRYLPTRTIELGCNLARESRSADTSTLTYAYGANTVSCSAQFSVQP